MSHGKCHKQFFDLFSCLIEHSIGHGKSRDVCIYARLNGLDGGAPESLRKTAARYDLSSERVRQICDHVSRFAISGFQKSECYADIYERVSNAMDVICEMTPSTDDRISETLIAKGIIVPGTLASSVVRIADVVGLNRGVRIDDWAGKVALMSVGSPKCFNSLVTHSRKIASASGAFNVEMLCESFAATKQIDLSAADAHAMVSSFAERIDVPAGHGVRAGVWFYFPGSASDAITRARNRIASFGWCSLTQLASIDSSKTRSRYGYKVPPAVLGRVLKGAGFEISGDKAFAAEAGKDCGAGLSEVQQVMVSIMREMGGRAKQSDFIRECETRGIKTTTVRAYIYRSGIFRRASGFCELAP